MKKLLYFSQTDWDWIAQRPQFMALELDKHYDLTVLYPKFITGAGSNQKETPKPAKCIAVHQVPFQERNGLLQGMGDRHFQKAIGNIYEYDILWFCTPLFFRFVPGDYRGLVIYDHMDDIVRLQASATVAKRTESLQDALFERADHVFTTSTRLMNGLTEGIQRKTTLVRNAFTGDVIIPPKIHEKLTDNIEGKKQRYRLAYIGTVAEWMDFPLLEKSTDLFTNIEYHFYGPVSGTPPHNERFFFHGVIEHEDIPEIVKDYDALIMPFVLNNIVLAVDPVKLYEYVSFGKCIICVRYPEVEPFSPFAYMYDSRDDYMELISSLTDSSFPAKYDADMQRDFLSRSTWKSRADEVVQVLEELSDHGEQNVIR